MVQLGDVRADYPAYQNRAETLDSRYNVQYCRDICRPGCCMVSNHLMGAVGLYHQPGDRGLLYSAQESWGWVSHLTGDSDKPIIEMIKEILYLLRAPIIIQNMDWMFLEEGLFCQVNGFGGSHQC